VDPQEPTLFYSSVENQLVSFVCKADILLSRKFFKRFGIREQFPIFLELF